MCHSLPVIEIVNNYIFISSTCVSTSHIHIQTKNTTCVLSPHARADSVLCGSDHATLRLHTCMYDLCWGWPAAGRSYAQFGVDRVHGGDLLIRSRTRRLYLMPLPREAPMLRHDARPWRSAAIWTSTPISQASWYHRSGRSQVQPPRG